jgi:hypothetical protein
MKPEIFNRFSINPQIQNFLQIRPVAAELLHADGQTDMNLKGYFAILRKAPENVL